MFDKFIAFIENHFTISLVIFLIILGLLSGLTGEAYLV